MAYKCVTVGMEEVMHALDSLGNAAQGAAAAGLYESAGKYADSVGRAIQGITTEPFKYVKKGKRKPSPEEKAVLLAAGAAGIAKFNKNGISVDTSIGFNNSGYAEVSWSHMNSRIRTNYKVTSGSGDVAWSFRTKLARGSDGHVGYDKSSRGKQNAKPIPVIANAINSGTSFMEKQPFFRKGISKADGEAKAAFEAKVEEVLDQVANK